MNCLAPCAFSSAQPLALSFSISVLLLAGVVGIAVSRIVFDFKKEKCLSRERLEKVQ